MFGSRTRGGPGTRGKGEKGKGKGEHICLSPWPALTDLAAWLHWVRVGQTKTERKRSSMASKRLETGHGKTRGLGGLLGVLFLVKSMAFPGRSVRTRYRRRASPASRHPAEPSSHDSGRRRSMPSKSSTIADQLATTQESKVSVQIFPLAVGRHHTSGPRCNGEARGGVMAFLPEISSVVYCVDSWTRWPP